MHTSEILLGFGFGNLAILGWIGAAAAPLLIHLWSRRKYREMSWAAIDFLLAALRKNARRIRLEQWLLLAIRTLLILLIVSALAQPFLERAGLVFVAGVPTHRVLVIDTSFSMAYRPSDQSRFERAKELASQIVEEGTRGDAFTLVTMGEPPRAVIASPAFAPGEVIEEIENLQLQHAGADLSTTLVQIEEILTNTRRKHPRLSQHEIYILSDLQRASWAPDFSDQRGSAEFRERSVRLAETAALTVIDLSQPGSENLVVTELTTPDSFTTISRDIVVEAQVRNYGRRAQSHQLLELYVDGRRAGEEYLDLEPGGEAAASFTYRFDTGGDHQVEVRLAGDLLEVDNHRWLALPVKQTVRVLCINGKPAGAAFRDATDYLVVALEPSGDLDRAMIRPDVAPESSLLELDLDRYDCIFLCNVGQFTSSEARVLENYLRQGGGLVFFLGDQVQPDSYNRHLAGDGPKSAQVLPAELADLVDEGTHYFDPLDYLHPIVQVFRGQENAGLLNTPISTYYRLRISDTSSAKIALGFDGGDPAIVEQTIHSGRSILVATSADVNWTMMPMLPSYVPIVQKLLATAVGGRLSDRNVSVGDPVGGTVETFSNRAGVTLDTPGGESLSLRLEPEGRRGRWSYPKTERSGIYKAQAAASGSEQRLFAVNVDSTESDLSSLSSEVLAGEIWPDVNYRHQTTWQDMDNSVVPDVSRREGLHLWMLYGVLSLLFAESLLAWRFGYHHA